MRTCLRGPRARTTTWNPRWGNSCWGGEFRKFSTDVFTQGGKNMRKLLKCTLAFTMLNLTLLTWGATVARSADKEHKLAPGEAAFEVMLLRQPSVRDDLKLSHDEASKIENFTREQWEKAKDISKLTSEAE